MQVENNVECMVDYLTWYMCIFIFELFCLEIIWTKLNYKAWFN